MPCGGRSQRRQAGRGEPPERGPRHRLDRPPPVAVLPGRRLDRARIGRAAWRPVSKPTSSKGSTPPTTAAHRRAHEHRAGVIKIAGSAELTDRERRVFERPPPPTRGPAARSSPIAPTGSGPSSRSRCSPSSASTGPRDAVAHRQGGRPRLPSRDPRERRVRRVRPGLPLEAEVDNGTLTLLAWMIEDGYGDQLMLGLDAARQGYWTTYGGSPGWAFLLGEFAERDARSRHRRRRPARALRHQPGPRVCLRGDRVTEPAPRLGGNLDDERRRLVRPSVVAGRRRRRGRSRRARACRHRRAPGRRRRYRAARPGGGRHRRRDRRRDAPRRLLHRRVLPPPHRPAPARARAPGGGPGHDQQHRFEVLEPIAAPDGLGVVEEFRYARTRTTAAQGHDPGAVHPVGRLVGGTVYRERLAAAEAFVPILAAEVRALVAEGATFIQIDEPSPAIHPDAPADFAALFNPVVADVPAGRPAGDPPVLRQLHGPAAREADLPAGARPAPPVRRPRARARVRQPRDGRARGARRADRSGSTSRPA